MGKVPLETGQRCHGLLDNAPHAHSEEEAPHAHGEEEEEEEEGEEGGRTGPSAQRTAC